MEAKFDPILGKMREKDVGGGGTAGTVDWSDVLNKPSAYPPSGHKHTTDQVEGLADVAESGSYNDLKEIPSAFPPVSHEHAIGAVIGLQTSLNGKQGIMQYSSMPTASASLAGKIVQYVGNGIGTVIVSGGGEANGAYTLVSGEHGTKTAVYEYGSAYSMKWYETETRWQIYKGDRILYYGDGAEQPAPWLYESWWGYSGEIPWPTVTNGGLSGYTNGHFYKCVEDGGSYKWQAVSVQDAPPSPSGGISAATFNGEAVPVAEGTATITDSQMKTVATTLTGASVSLSHEGIYEHEVASAVTYNLPAVAEGKTEDIVINASLKSSASIAFVAFIAPDGSTIVPELVGTPAVGEQWTFLCRYAFGEWKVFGLKAGDIPVLAPSVIVSGAGTAEANGEYPLTSGQHGTQSAVYERSSGGNVYKIYYNGNNWDFLGGDDLLYTGDDMLHAMTPWEEDWMPLMGSNPTPTVTEG